MVRLGVAFIVWKCGCAFIGILLAASAQLSVISGEADSLAGLRKEIDDLRQRVAQKSNESAPLSRAIESRMGGTTSPQGPAGVKTRSGRLRIGGLAQIWAYSIQNDSMGIVDLNSVFPGGFGVSNKLVDNDSLRVRRAELRFNLEISENIAAVTSLDFARENTGFPYFPSNQGFGDADPIYFLPCG